jgi:hypothetical protein
MNVITDWQPYASLIMLGLKPHETRSWATHLRGEIAIHAGKHLLPQHVFLHHMTITQREYIMKIIEETYGGYDRLPLGFILGTVQLGEPIPTEQAIEQVDVIDRLCGDYSSHRYAWPVSEPKMFERIVPAKGQLGIWHWNPPEGVIKNV